ncbi:MAG: hypothetical protein CVU50_01005 [Candidatus Cloacimonetes bacterium HGW-Cloacimonetes-3]|nr:MAG: hypothetical protein CVU50_01005 [Candidatus Cloacimonetes bacterium HGW-Cloacimonetes-3]
MTIARIPKNPGTIFKVCFLLLMIVPTFLAAVTEFSFSVQNLESYDRTGNWVYDADNPGFPTGDMNHFTFNATSPHFYADMWVHSGTTPGKVTAITCTSANPALAPNPALLALNFKKPDNTASEFELVSFRRVNTVNPLNNWATAGEAGDVRVYSNAFGQLVYNGVPKLYLKNATFVITTPYPNQATMRTVPGMSSWVGNIGNGTFPLGNRQTGYGFGDLDTVLSDPDWLAPFAASNYKVDLSMDSILSVTSTNMGWYDFGLNISPAALPSNPVNTDINLDAGFPIVQPFAAQNVEVNITAGTKGGEALDLSTFYVNEITQEPAGTFPPALPRKAPLYWQFGSTMNTFEADIRLQAALAKASADWIVVTRIIGTDQWYTVPEFVALGIDTRDLAMQFVPWNGSYWEVTDVQRALEFSLAAPDVPLPVTLSSFTASVNAQNLIALAWSTASETSLRGFKVYFNTSNTDYNSICLTPDAISPQNSSSGASYSFVASELSQPGVYFFWLEALSNDGSSEFFGPISKTLSTTETPTLPLRNLLSDAYPNPFRTGSTSRFEVELKAGEKGEIAIYNVVGQVVKSISVSEGYHTLNWDGKDSKGNNCASGIYFYKLSTPSLTQTKKLVIVR